MAYRSRWVDTNPDHVEWLENRVEALAARVVALQTEVNELRRTHAKNVQAHFDSLCGLLVQPVPMQTEVRSVTPPPFPKALQGKFARGGSLDGAFDAPTARPGRA